MNPYDCAICHNDGFPHASDCPNRPRRERPTPAPETAQEAPR